MYRVIALIWVNIVPSWDIEEVPVDVKRMGIISDISMIIILTLDIIV